MMIYIAVLISYLLGSVPVGYLVARWVKGVDIRRSGSGNVGATNVARVAGAGAGAVTLVLDILKGVAAVTIVPLLVHNVRPDIACILCALAVVAGHNWTVFLRFRGGKGIAVTAGVFIGLVPTVFLSALCVWTAVFIIGRYVSLASIAAAGSLPLFLVMYGEPVSFQLMGAAVAVVGILRHKDNIRRLLSGKESKFRLWKK